MFQKVDTLRTADAVVQQIEELILNGVLRPGDRLPSERDLAVELDVSRPVLRAALKTLEERYLVVARQGGGTFIADVIGPIFSEPIIDLVERHPAARADYLEFRRDIEAIAAAHAAERATSQDHTILTQILVQMDEAFLGDELDTREPELDIELHQAIGEAAHNVILLHNLRSCYRLLENGVFCNRQKLYGHPTARKKILDQHHLLVERICARDAAGAFDAAQNHIDFVGQALLEAEATDNRQAVASLRQHHRGSSTKPSNPTLSKTNKQHISR
ncbi:MAG: FadR family transcriptional regulator [Rhodobacteraceae bacterium]|nr:FadR family transcriptional regulator [Paracoccaceae bacterium]